MPSTFDEGVPNITDWALKQFNARYNAGKKSKQTITKDAIFRYVYGVLHDPIYHEKYGQNLRREFPHIPFYADFWKWAAWGEKLVALHIGYETVKPWNLKRVDVPDKKSKGANLPPKPSLKANKDTGAIVLDTETQLTGVPSEAWGYKLGNRSAIEWVLDQAKEKTPKDPQSERRSTLIGSQITRKTRLTSSCELRALASRPCKSLKQ